MTPADFDAYLKAFGIPGGMLAAMVYLFMTRKTETPGPSRLEEDMKALRGDLRSMADEVHDIRDRVSRIEGRMDK